MCTFAVQTVFCGNISGEMSRSDTLLCNPAEGIIRTTVNFDNTNIRFSAVLSAAGFLLILLAASTFVFVTIIILLLKRKPKVQMPSELTPNTDICNGLTSTKDIIAKENIAYDRTTNIDSS